MQTKQLILLITTAILLSILLTFPTYAVGEEGTGTLYVYTDPERTTLAETDSEGRYVTVPGVEYYFTVSGITEYSVGTNIAIWVYRVDTAENIKIGNFEVNTAPFDALFTWTIPDDWLDEVANIKYGTSLESDWLFAQKEIWVNARVGEGILYVYIDTWGGIEADLTEDKHYLVYPSATYYFTIEGITEYTTEISIWARYRDTNELIDVGTPPDINFEWLIPADLPIDTEIKIKYGTDFTGSLDKWLYARREAEAAPRLLFVIPEVFLGSVGAIMALFSGLGVKTLIRRKKT